MSEWKGKVIRTDFAEQVAGPVGAAVVDKNNLVGAPHRIHVFHDLRVKRPETLLFVK